jgi:hypothetical protein
MSVDLEGEVLEGVAVLDRVGRVGLGQVKDTWVLADAVVLDVTLANCRHVEKTVEKIRRPVEVGGTVRDVPAEAAHSLERATELVGQVTDDSLTGGV